ncbi:DNA-binding helix-turn-helix protein [Leptospira ryugenii]|uniref:DNA-binding helix-turn-helix protein n=1 Tax=Leptospira ryugenii TaxID=1917863 RepID=A0A2P2DXF1_9LEPT|nr:helix-turn-helix domain-containing protein [Leptospira ryugenii]GBF49308.1 DNA-binding helix-turn-helix protein [Leptospira ryugenii]
MEYTTFKPHKDLSWIVDCYWTLLVPKQDNPKKQRIIPDGFLEMAFILGDDIKRYTSTKDYILQPRAMILGQTIDPFYIEPTGYVDTFSIRFIPYGLSHLFNIKLNSLVNKETPLDTILGETEAKELQEQIINAKDAAQRISHIESFLRKKLSNPQKIDCLVKSTLDTIFETLGKKSIQTIVGDSPSLRRKLERKFKKEMGLSPKQYGKIVRFQAALKMLLNRESENLTEIAHMFDYYDQAHFIKDFKDFTSLNPKDFLNNDAMALSSIFYK